MLLILHPEFCSFHHFFFKTLNPTALRQRNLTFPVSRICRSVNQERKPHERIDGRIARREQNRTT